MSICGWLILGGLAGWIASMIAGRNDQQGCIMNIIVGIIGAAIGGAIVGLLGGGGVTGFNLPSLIVAVLGAVVLLAIVNLITRRK
ncbi:MAG: GlsB/YeaQ/YmgE family stress response membrane protein [Candidatus Promineifilaceae bacterium]